VKGGYFDYKSKRSIVFDKKDGDKISVSEGKPEGDNCEKDVKENWEEQISFISDEEILSMMGLIIENGKKKGFFFFTLCFFFTLILKQQIFIETEKEEL
jgi:hypothetical protein